MPTVFVLNNYPFEEVWGEVTRGEKPDHHLYGINYFHQRGFNVKIIPFKGSPFVQAVGRLSSKTVNLLPLGDLDRQWSTLKILQQADLIYAPCQTQTHFLSYLRALGLLRVPIVCIAHHPLFRGRLAQIRSPSIGLMVRGTDAFPSLSLKVAEEVNKVAHSSLKSQLLNWGPQTSFYPKNSDLGHGVVAAGRTGRDFVTFGLAASQTKIDAHIICLESAICPSFDLFENNIKITTRPDIAPMKYPELLQIYQNARVIAIPMVAGLSLCGLTSLVDALGMGKPVIMTRNSLIDIDIEREGIGKWVEPGDIEGWKNALRFFENEDNEPEVLAMGQKARNLVEAGLNSNNFANQIMDIFENVLTHL